MQDNPYHSPDAASGAAEAACDRTRAADMALLGLVYGGTIGAAAGAAAVAGWGGWSALMNVPGAVTTDHLTAAEALISSVVARLVLGGCLGGAAGAVIGPAAGLLAAVARPSLCRHLTAITTTTSALAAVACVLLVWYVSGRSEAQQAPLSEEMLAFSVAAGAIGGLVLGSTLSARASTPFSSTKSELQ